MNNETNNNNVNNPGMPAGISFVQGGTPVSSNPNNVPPQQSAYQMPGPVPAPVAPTAPMPGPTPVVPEPVQPITPEAPQPVAPEPIKPTPLNFVQSGAPTPTPTTPQPMTPPPAINPAPVAPTPMPGPTPITGTPTPMMPGQPAMGSMPSPTMPGNMPPAGMAPTGMPANAATPTEGEKPPLPIVMIIITILVVAGVAVFLSMYLTGKINFGGKKNNNPQPTVVDKTQNEVNLPNWMSYLLDKNTTEIKISRYVDSSNTKTEILTKEQLKNLFTKMKDYNVVKYYSSSKTMSNDDLQITYILNDTAYTFTLSGEYIEPGEDNGLLTFFTDSSITVEDDGETSRDGEDYHYILKNFNSSVYDEYFNT